MGSCCHTVVAVQATLLALSTVAAEPGWAIRLSGPPAVQAEDADKTASDDTTLSDSVAVLPFTNISGDPTDDWLGEGIAETVVADIESRGRSDYRLYRRGTEPGRKSNRPKSSRWTASTVLTIASCRL